MWPSGFVANRKTRQVHKVLTSYVDVGNKAIAWCGFKYGLADVSLHTDLPVVDRELYCSTCLEDVRATMTSAKQVG